MTGAFQANAFQADAYQIGAGVCTPAFQRNAFQANAFQVCEAPPVIASLVLGSIVIRPFFGASLSIDAAVDGEAQTRSTLAGVVTKNRWLV